MNRCKICEAKTRTLIDEKKELKYYRCESCGFVALDDNSVVEAQVEKAHYAKHNNSFECSGYVEMFEKFIDKAVEPYLETSKKILDFGCGHTPVLAELLRRRKLDVDIYDYYFYPKELYKNNQYDLIISTEVFEHLQEPKKILETLTSSLKDNAYLVLMTQFPPEDDAEFLKWWYRRDITHIGFFTPKSFELLAKEFGLRVIKAIDNNIVVFQKIC